MSRPTLRKVGGHRNLAADAKVTRPLVCMLGKPSSSQGLIGPSANFVAPDAVIGNVASEEAEPSTAPCIGNPLGIPFSSIPRLIIFMEQAYQRDDEENFCAIATFYASHVVDISNWISRISPEKEDFQFARSSLSRQLETFNSAAMRVRTSSSEGNNEMYIAKEYAKMVRDGLQVLFNVAKPLPPPPIGYRERRGGILLEVSRDKIQISKGNKDLKRKSEVHRRCDRVGSKRVRCERRVPSPTTLPQDPSANRPSPPCIPPLAPTPMQPILEGPRSEEIYNLRHTILFFGEAKFPTSAECLAEGTDGVKLGKDNRIQATSLPALIRILTSKDGLHEPSLSQVVLGSFCLFVTPAEFLQELTKRYNTQPPSSLAQAEVEEWNVKISNIHVRVLAIIYSWLDQHWQPDRDAAVLREIRSFVEKRSEKDIPRGVIGSLLTKIEDREMCSERELIEKQRWDIAQTSAKRSPFSEHSNFIFPSEFAKSSAHGLLCIDTQDGRKELARHLTLKMSNLFQKLNPSKVVQLWYRKGESSREYREFEKEPGVKELAAVSAYGESLTLWVISSIVEVNDFDLRVRRLSFWVDVASRCMEHLDYATAHNIYVSLNSSPVIRLKKTILMVPYSCKERFKKLVEFFDDRSYTLFRQTFDHLLPSLPPTTPLLRDIIQVKARVEGEAYTNTCRTDEDGRKLIFIDECKVTHQAKRVLNKALMEYKFQRDKRFSCWLNECIREFSQSHSRRDKSYDRLYQTSTGREPRQPEPSNPWEFCSSTPVDPLKGRTKCFGFSRIASLERNKCFHLKVLLLPKKPLSF